MLSSRTFPSRAGKSRQRLSARSIGRSAPYASRCEWRDTTTSSKRGHPTRWSPSYGVPRHPGKAPPGLTEKAGKVPVMADRLQEELISRLMELFARTLDHQGTCLETLELTYAQAKLIWRLEANDTPSLKE